MEIEVLKGSEMKNGNYWHVIQTKINGVNMHTITENTKQLNIGQHIDMPYQINKSIEWMHYKEIDQSVLNIHNNICQVFINGNFEFCINDKLSFGIYKGF